MGWRVVYVEITPGRCDRWMRFTPCAVLPAASSGASARSPRYSRACLGAIPAGCVVPAVALVHVPVLRGEVGGAWCVWCGVVGCGRPAGHPAGRPGLLLTPPLADPGPAVWQAPRTCARGQDGPGFPGVPAAHQSPTRRSGPAQPFLPSQLPLAGLWLRAAHGAQGLHRSPDL